MSLILELATLVAGALLLAALVPRVHGRPRTRRRPSSAVRPAALERIERVVTAGRQTTGDVHVQVRPLLREIAAQALSRHGVRLDAEPARARALLGEELFALVRLDLPPPHDRRAPGLELAQLERLTDRLERL